MSHNQEDSRLYEELLNKVFELRRKGVEERKRFEIPKAIVERSGQKTILRNFGEIAKIFRRDEKHFAKFLLRELATLGAIKDNALVMNGIVSKEIIQRKIEEYAKLYVICKECGQADTLLVKEGRYWFIRCEACGAKYPAK